MHLASWTLEPVRLTLRPQPCVIELRKDAGETGHFDGDLIFYTKGVILGEGQGAQSCRIKGFIVASARMLRFVVLINCYTLQADRAGGLRRVAELVANVLPDLGKRRLGSVHVSQCDAMSLCESLDQ